ncbi:MAG: Holliday junction resolvase RuvX [Candidatus Omnitrophica bacterium]|nr:Holliday junction resolvase RuvX [Candidatus Omnitrophota bacterium]
MGRVLCLDFGEKRIGIALSDELGFTAQGLEVLERKGMAEDINYIKVITEKNNVSKVVVGLPLNMDGGASEKSKDVLRFVEKLKSSLKLPVETWDERLSSLEANKVLISADMSRRKRKKVVDKIAAQIILQCYLDSRHYSK